MFSKLLILNQCVSNFQVPTTPGAPWGKVNVSEFMDFELRTKKTRDSADSAYIQKNNCYIVDFGDPNVQLFRGLL